VVPDIPCGRLLHSLYSCKAAPMMITKVMERGPEMNMKVDVGLGLAIHWVQQAPVSAYEDNCNLRPIKT